MTVLLIYHPPKANSAFIHELHNLLSTFCSTSANIIILGDLNIHVDVPSAPLTTDFLKLSELYSV